eukprot:2300069-Prymnesium_polylepis.1
MILSHACSTPGAAAVSDEHGECTYAELVSMAWSLGDALASQGLAQGATVGVLLSARALMPVTLLGLGLRRMVPCNLSTFRAQRQLQLERVAALPCGCAAVLVDSDVPDAAAGSGLAVVRVDQLTLDATLAPRSVSAAHAALAPRADALSDVCFIDWTSGSTGRPKGMATTMWKMAHWVRWRAYHFPLARCGARVAMGLFLP